jgi:glycosyltransferase involved in cell wall biosynthesis
MSAGTPGRDWPKVTIMIPTYGQADMVLEAIDSALAQDYPNLEVVVADDASPDNTREVVAGRSDPRLRYHRNRENLGRVANYRNTLYELATGEWVVNLDGDDRYTDPGFVSAAMAVALSDSATVMVSARRTVERNGLVVDVTKIPDAPWLAGVDLVRGLPAVSHHLPHMTTLYRRAPAMELGFYRRDLISGDWESLYRLALHGRVAFVDRIVGAWRAGEANASRVADWRARASNLQIWQAIFAEAVQAGLPGGEAARVQALTMSYFAYLGFSDVLASAGAGAAWRYLAVLWREQWPTAWRLLLDPRCLLRLGMAALVPRSGRPR